MRSKKAITVLCVETSCDETAIAILDCFGGWERPRFRIRTNVVASQIKIHAPWGGVVPNLAKREHTKNLPVILQKALTSVRKTTPLIDVIAVTIGPGLEPALWTGINFARDLARRWDLPLLAINHMEGHMVAVLLHPRNRTLNIEFPALALLISGGHTELVVMKQWLEYIVIGQTLDDAAGEAFDKVGRMLGLNYPGGPAVSRAARTGHAIFTFPRPMIQSKNYHFSFSGLKTAVLYTLRDLEKRRAPFSKNDIAASFEEAIVDVLVSKTLRAAKALRVRSIIVGGGVAANRLICTPTNSFFETSKKEERKREERMEIAGGFLRRYHQGRIFRYRGRSSRNSQPRMGRMNTGENQMLERWAVNTPNPTQAGSPVFILPFFEGL